MLPRWKDVFYIGTPPLSKLTYEKNLDVVHRVYSSLLACSKEEFESKVTAEIIEGKGKGFDSLLHFFPRSLAEVDREYHEPLGVLYGELFRVVIRMIDCSVPQGEPLWNRTRILDIISLFGEQQLFFSRFSSHPDNEALLLQISDVVLEQQETLADADYPEYDLILRCLKNWRQQKALSDPSLSASRYTASSSSPADSSSSLKRSTGISVHDILLPKRDFSLSLDIGLGVDQGDTQLRESILYEVVYDDDPDEHDDLQKFELELESGSESSSSEDEEEGPSTSTPQAAQLPSSSSRGRDHERGSERRGSRGRRGNQKNVSKPNSSTSPSSSSGNQPTSSSMRSTDLSSSASSHPSHPQSSSSSPTGSSSTPSPSSSSSSSSQRGGGSRGRGSNRGGRGGQPLTSKQYLENKIERRKNRDNRRAKKTGLP